jgi:amicyanin
MAGFEFTIPFTLARYFGHRRKPPAAISAVGVTPGSSEVRIAGLSFTTAELRVPAGTHVRWLNDDPVPHSVKADSGAFDSGLLDPGHTFEQLFDQPGTFPYYCTQHPFMRGRVIVEP